MADATHRDFLAIPDFTQPELLKLFDLAERMRKGEYTAKPLAGKSLAMIFMKSSTRTRVCFEVGAWQLGGHALFLSPRDVQLGRGEPIADTARVLSRYVDGIMIRTFAHSEVEELARYASVPVINGLTDLLHPCQILADLLTVRQHLGTCEGKKVAWIGDGNNMANSWINAAYRLGFELVLACPEGYDPDRSLLERARAAKNVTVVRDPAEAAKGADVVNTDVWASMGQEEEQAKREIALQGLHGGPEAHVAREQGRDLPALSPGAPGRGGRGRRDRRSAEQGVGRGGEPSAHPEGADGGADGRTSRCPEMKLAAVLLVLSAFRPVADELPPDLAAALSSYDRAHYESDLPRLSSLVTDDYVLVNSDASVENKEQFLADFRLPGFKIEPYVREQSVNKVWDGGAVTAAIVRLSWTQDGAKHTRALRYADVWMKKNGQWLVTFTQVTRVQ